MSECRLHSLLCADYCLTALARLDSWRQQQQKGRRHCTHGLSQRRSASLILLCAALPALALPTSHLTHIPQQQTNRIEPTRDEPNTRHVALSMSADPQQMADDSESSGKARVVITTRHGAAAAAATGSASSGSAPKRHVVKTKGRGFQSGFSGESAEDRYSGRGGEFESLDTDAAANTDAQKCTNAATSAQTQLRCQ